MMHRYAEQKHLYLLLLLLLPNPSLPVSPSAPNHETSRTTVIFLAQFYVRETRAGGKPSTRLHPNGRRRQWLHHVLNLHVRCLAYSVYAGKLTSTPPPNEDVEPQRMVHRFWTSVSNLCVREPDGIYVRIALRAADCLDNKLLMLAW